MKFAHMADVHIGGWQDPKMKALGLEAFRRAMSICVESKVDFILISGDLFNTALPQIDLMMEVAGILKNVNDSKVPVYIVAGSHDFSPSGKTMLGVFEKAGLMTNVVNFDNEGNLLFTETKDGVKITGLLGKRGGLEKNDYEALNRKRLEEEEGFKIFMFHTTINEFKPAGLEDVDGQSVASLPEKFNYYAGGHVHYIFRKEHGNGLLAYPGALFPNNFKELEEFKLGGFYLVDEASNAEYVPVKVKDVLTFNFNAEGKTPEALHSEILDEVSSENIDDKIVLMRVAGTLASGKPSDVKFNEIFKQLSSAYYVEKNIAALNSKEFEEVQVKGGSVEDVEQEVITEHIAQLDLPDFDSRDLAEYLMSVLDKEKADGEKSADFEKRIISEASKVLKL
ncbi:MAG: DNA repair exonuclease [Candidatus Woesearchaeota archaeon]